LTFESDTNTVYWRLSWGGASYTGPGTVVATPAGNDNDGNANPPFGGALPSTTLQALQFLGAAGAVSTTNAADYAVTAGASVWVNNATASFTLIGTGACCRHNTGTCQDNVVLSNCQGGFDEWTQGMLCAALPPCLQTGACCNGFTTGCTNNVTQADCSSLALHWFPGMTCSQVQPCVQTGACCNGFTLLCSDDVAQVDCSAPPLSWFPAMSCTQVAPCVQTGACCNGVDLTCTDNVEQTNCMDFGETWFPAMTCMDVEPCEAIPTMSEWGALAMGALLLGGGGFVLQRRHKLSLAA
jgi:hypothetical protein